MKNFVRIFCAVLACAVIGGVFSLNVFAANAANTVYEIKELNMSIPVPNNMLVVTRETGKSDSFFSEFGLDYKETMDNLKNGNIYLQAVKDDSLLTLTVTMTKTDESEKIGNYNNLSDEEMTNIKEELLKDKSYKSASFTDSKGTKYISLSMSYKVGKETVKAQQYNTVVNGENINITVQSAPGSKLKKADTEALAGIIADTTILSGNFFTENKNLLIYGGVTLLGIILVVVVIVIVLKVRKNPARKHKNLVHEMAHERRISETTQIPRPRVNPVAEQTQSFLTNYEPIEEIDKPKKSRKARHAAEKAEKAKVISEPVAEEAFEEFVPVEETAPEIVEPEVIEPEIIEPETVEPEITEPEITEPEIAGTEAFEAAAGETVSNVDEIFDSPLEDEVPESEVEQTAEAETVEEEELSRTVAAAFESADGVEVFDEGFEDSSDYFDEAPEEEEDYVAETDVDEEYIEDEADEYVSERRSRQRNAGEAGETVKKIFSAIGKVLLAIGKGIFLVFKYIIVGIIYVITHIRYFCINCYRLIKRNRAKKKRIKAEEQRRREASARRRAQREAERARQQRNAKRRDENDLIKVRSSGDRRGTGSQTARRSSGSRTAYPSGRSGSSAPRRR